MNKQQLCQKLKELIISSLNLPIKADEIQNDTELYGNGLGLDSVDILELMLVVHKEFNVELNNENMKQINSVESLCDFIMLNNPSIMEENNG